MNSTGKGTLLHCWECELVQLQWRTVWQFLRKLKIQLAYGPVIPLLVIYLDKTIIQKDTCIPMFIAHYSQYPRHETLTEEWIKKMHIQWYKKEWNNNTCRTWIQLEILILQEVRKTNTVWDHFYVESKIWRKGTENWEGPDPAEHAGHGKEAGFPWVAVGSYWVVGNRRGTRCEVWERDSERQAEGHFSSSSKGRH